MLTNKRKHHVEIFCFYKSQWNNAHCIIYIFSDSCFSAAHIAKTSLLALTVASLDNHLVLHARCNYRPFVFIVVWCIARQADRNDEVVKHFHICIKVLSQFRTPYCTNLRQYSKRPKRGGAHDNVHIPSLYNFCFHLLRQKHVSAYNFAAVCCNCHVQKNMLSSNRFTSTQGKTISRLSEFRVSLQNFRVPFWHEILIFSCHTCVSLAIYFYIFRLHLRVGDKLI